MKIYSNMKEVPPHLFSKSKLIKMRLRPIGNIKATFFYASRQIELFDINETVEMRSLPKEALVLREKKRIEKNKNEIQKFMDIFENDEFIEDENNITIYKIYGFFKLNGSREGRVYVAIQKSKEKDFFKKILNGDIEYDFSSRNLLLETADKSKALKVADVFIE